LAVLEALAVEATSVRPELASRRETNREPASKHLYGRMLNLGDAILLRVVRYDNFPVIEEPERSFRIATPSKFSILL